MLGTGELLQDVDDAVVVGSRVDPVLVLHHDHIEVVQSAGGRDDSFRSVTDHL
jgi:hypothetical protein